MFQSTLTAIIAQLPALCDKYNIYTRRDAYFEKCKTGEYMCNIENLCSQTSDIKVNVGEMNEGTSHTFVFDVRGNLRSVWHADWSDSGTVVYTRVVK